MMKMIMIILTLSTISFIFIKHPLSMGLMLLIQTTLIAMITGLMSWNFWFSYILFMIMIGGMLVLFIYMTSIASNEKFKITNKWTSFSSLILLMTTILLMKSDFFSETLISMNTDTLKFDLNSQFIMSLSKYLNFPANMMTILVIIYLLIALIAVVKITHSLQGPLRQKY